jgi:DNA relaxase NicK
VMEKLLADGTVTSYGMETEDFHSGKLGRVDFYTTVSDAAAIDKVDQAMNELFEKNPALGDAFQSMTERDGHRDYLMRLRYLKNK